MIKQGQTLPATVLLNAFTESLRVKLVEIAMTGMREAAVAESYKVIEEMRPAIQQHYDQMRDQLVVHLTVEDPK